MAVETEKRLTQADRMLVWLDKDLVRKAKEIAAREDTTISEVIERELAKPINRRHDKLFAPAELGEAGA